MDKIFDTSKEAWAKLGISLNQNQYNDLCLINMMFAGDYKNDSPIPVHYILLVLKTLGLIGGKEADDQSVNIITEESKQKWDEKFQKTFGKIKEY